MLDRLAQTMLPAERVCGPIASKRPPIGESQEASNRSQEPARGHCALMSAESYSYEDHEDEYYHLAGRRCSASAARLGHRTCAKRRKDGASGRRRGGGGGCLAVGLIYLLSLAGGASLTFAAVAAASSSSSAQSPQSSKLPDLTSATSDEPVVAIVGQDAFVSCVAKNLQNYTIIWRFANEANAAAGDTGPVQPASSSAAASAQPSFVGASSSPSPPSNDELGVILTAGRQRVISDDRFTVIQSHDTWLLKISNVRLADTGTYVCHTNSEPRVRALRVLSVVRPAGPNGDQGGQLDVDNTPGKPKASLNHSPRSNFASLLTNKQTNRTKPNSKLQRPDTLATLTTTSPSVVAPSTLCPDASACAASNSWPRVTRASTLCTSASLRFPQ